MRAAFTLVEMLVVITIIGILAALGTAAAMSAIRTAKVAAIALEIKQLEMACQAYKEKFGEYPPDFAGINGTGSPPDLAAQAAVTRHLARAFPRYTGNWADATTGLPGVLGLQLADLTPQRALVIWLAGIPDANGNPSGFAADPTNPFQLPAADLARPSIPVCPSRIGPFFDFDRTRINSARFWSKGASPSQMAAGAGAIAYFRAENGAYTVVAADGTTTTKRVQDAGGANVYVYPAWNASANTWVNPNSLQIFSSGLNVAYSSPKNPPGPVDRLAFPTGDNYDVNTFDDITNFSGGTLEDKIP